MLRAIRWFVLCGLLLAISAHFASPLLQGAEQPLPQSWDYAAAMRVVSGKFKGRPGVVLHIGDSITYANPYSQWARAGAGQTPEQKAVLQWMHTGTDDDRDGWWLCRFDHPDGGRSYTACGGLRANELLQGGKQRMPPLKDLLDKYQPQVTVVMLGTNDVSAKRPVKEYVADMARIVDLHLERGIVPILSTIPPHIAQRELARVCNVALRKLTKERQLPLIDYEAEILKRRPDDWNGTLLNKDDVHPTAGVDKTSPTSAPTAENLRNSGYLLRDWLSVEKLREVKTSVIDAPSRVAVKSRALSGLPTGEIVRLPVARDTWFSNVGQEAECNLGGSSRLKLKSNQEMTMVDFGPARLRGRVILAATLHLKKSGSDPLKRVSISSFASEWVEGTATSYAPEAGSSTHRAQRHPNVPWAGPGSDLTAVTLGNGHTAWWMADAFPPDESDWQKVAVEPTLLALRSAGISHGFLVFDDTGSEWQRDGEKVKLIHMPNRFVFSKDAGPAQAPYFTVVLGDKDDTAPGIVNDLQVDAATEQLPGGEARISWTTPADSGAGTVGFLVEADGKPVPRYTIPLAGKSGQKVVLDLHPVGVTAGTKVDVRVRAVDGAGNVGPPATLSVRLSGRQAEPLPGAPSELFRGTGALPKLGAAEVAIIDALDKVHPITGAMIPPQPAGYLLGNHLWSAHEPSLRLHAARNEFVSFQILVRGKLQDVQPTLTFKTPDAGAKPQVTFGELRHVQSTNGPLPDPVVPLKATFSVPSANETLDGQRSGSLLCEIYVPHQTKAGHYTGALTLKAGQQSLEVPVTLQVWDFTLPDVLSFLPEMNCYGLPANERDYYRVAHRHRTVLNRVPYSQRGQIDDGCAPGWDGKTLNFAEWDKRFGEYFSGQAFADLPRKGVPIECFYLPMHENWPTPINDSYNGSYWADTAFTPAYRAAFVSATSQFGGHIASQNWSRTLFQGFLNNKVDYKSKGWSRGSAPWLLDEPSSFQDYWALRFFGAAFQEGAGTTPGLVFRGDISRPQWQRDALDPVLDYNVVAGGAFREYRSLVLERKERFGQIVVDYGSANAITDSNVQPAGWCVDSWTLGSDGVVPWQTIGSQSSWKSADALALFYPGDAVGQTEPVPSLRLKAFLRGEQDVEYFTLLAGVLKRPHWSVGQEVRRALKLSGQRRGTGFTGGEDAGVMEYAQLRPQDLWAVRTRIGEALSRSAADARKITIERPPTKTNRGARGGYVTVGEIPDVPQ